MKESGSKIAVLIIVLVMVFLANLLFDATNDSVNPNDQKDNSPLSYEEVIKNETESGEVLPSFEDYIVDESLEIGDTLQPIQFDTAPLAKSFEKLINSNYDSIGANFAGHYSVITWSCGAECQNSIIIDTLTGEVVLYGLISTYGLSFSPNSYLLINNVHQQKELKSTTTVPIDYYELTEKEGLKLIAKVVDGTDLLEGCINATTTARNYLTNEIFVYKTPCHVPYGFEVVSN